ncbi:P1 family peptidase [Thermobrachium celere]|uniref:P1 family peptidase n=1 Tax=Thermobrachium celere TaxID=53422 RepID=UPI0019458CB8|nr:P1 family peptidase [Thermobrachium celere]GFR36693.1 peptidase [Thermobrachium celere]
MKEINITDIKGIKIGNAQNFEARTGCTVVICEEGATCGVDVRGGAPGTRETDLLNPVNLVDKVHAVVLSGGSAFGLDASCGVMQFLEERNIGFDVGVTKVPIVCSAVLFDLMVGDYRVRPDKKMGYEACVNAYEIKRIENGKFGAGTGATVGKILGPEYAVDGGLGFYAVKVGELEVGAVVAVNCLGDVVDPRTGEIIAGALNEDKTAFIDSTKVMLSRYNDRTNLFSGNTTIAVVVTNARLTKAEATKVSSMAHDAFARTMRPAHTMFDGDTIFTMATGEVEVDISTLGMIATSVLEEAIIRAVRR